MPGAALEITGDIQADPEDPGAQIPHLDYSGLGPPALEKDILHGILGVVGVAQQEPQRAASVLSPKHILLTCSRS